MISFILNIPYNALGLVVALVSVPKKIRPHKKGGALVINVDTLWWRNWYRSPKKASHAVTLGYVVLMGKHSTHDDLEHELVHVEQHREMPFLFPICYYMETMLWGYHGNKFEKEAFARVESRKAAD